jgi:hypothetical protein
VTRNKRTVNNLGIIIGAVPNQQMSVVRRDRLQTFDDQVFLSNLFNANFAGSVSGARQRPPKDP